MTGTENCCLLHGSDQNKITGKGAVIDYKPGDFSSMTPPETPQAPTDSQVQARSRAQEYSKMNKAEMNSAYDSLRQSDPAKAAIAGSKARKCTGPFLTSNYV